MIKFLGTCLALPRVQYIHCIREKSYDKYDKNPNQKQQTKIKSIKSKQQLLIIPKGMIYINIKTSKWSMILDVSTCIEDLYEFS